MGFGGSGIVFRISSWADYGYQAGVPSHGQAGLRKCQRMPSLNNKFIVKGTIASSQIILIVYNS